MSLVIDDIPNDEPIRDDEVGSTQTSPGFIAIMVLQDILVRMMGFLEEITLTAILPGTPDDSQNRVEGYTPDHMTAPEFQTPGAQPTIVVTPKFKSFQMLGLAKQWWRAYIETRPTGFSRID
ncbi:hypothetical protein HAX54_048957 [Datura stramonium]|uniref:Uncharacterized protein n=1 Tax=Datura stramonium TaxID=4076 RepID=A0ABS8RQH6_DATST|nr:hypothetical protein [Datura stramonium]